MSALVGVVARIWLDWWFPIVVAFWGAFVGFNLARWAVARRVRRLMRQFCFKNVRVRGDFSYCLHCNCYSDCWLSALSQALSDVFGVSWWR